MEYDELSELPWGEPQVRRLRDAAERAYKRGVTQAQIVEQTGISRPTLQRILAGQNPGWRRLQLIVDSLGVLIEAVVQPDEAGPDWVMVPIADIQVAAGPGRFPLDEATLGEWPFPRSWIESNWPKAKLRVVHVSGDSQEPVLRDGDAVLVDVTPTVGSDGMHIVRLDDALMIKRLQIEGARVRLKSHNPQYDDIVVDMRADQDRFAIIGRAVATVKAL